jgi:proline iminopeptidase
MGWLAVSSVAGQIDKDNQPSLEPTAASTAVEGHFTGADGVRLFYRKVGRGNDLIVFLHGGPGLNMGNGGYDMEPLSQRRTLLMYDQRGGGRSEIVTNSKLLTADCHVRDLEALRQHFKIERMKLVGLSWGAGLAVLYAKEHPERVERLLLVSPISPAKTPFFEERTKKIDALIGSAGVSRMNEIRQMLPQAGDDEAVALCREWFGLSSPPYFVKPEAFTRARSNRICDAPPAALRNRFVVVSATVGSLGDWDFRPHLARLQTPTLVVEGAKTNVPLPATREWAATMPNARLLLIPDAGHVHFIEQPAAFFSAAEQFLGGEYPKEAEIVRKSEMIPAK